MSFQGFKKLKGKENMCILVTKLFLYSSIMQMRPSVYSEGLVPKIALQSGKRWRGRPRSKPVSWECRLT